MFFFFCVANAFLSSGQGQDKGKGPDPLIKLVVHPQEHVIIPLYSFAVLHCTANLTAYPEYDYENDEPMMPNLEDLEQSDGPIDAISASSESFINNLCPQQEIQYQWTRNEHPISIETDKFVQIFCNGSIKIQHSPMAAGIYRCIANTTRPDVGAIISKASKVKTAGKLNI